MTAYTDQVQARLDRLEKMEPAFEAMKQQLSFWKTCGLDIFRNPHLYYEAHILAAVRKARKALELASEVGP